MVEYCPKCNAQLPPGMEKCPNCGQRLRTGSSDEYTWRDILGISMVVLLVVLVPVLLVIGIIALLVLR
jgi:zinc-ribbon domain